MTVSEAARAIGASVSRDRPVIGGDVVRSVCTDTRRGCEGAVFFALRGERSDGHDYVAEAGRAGAVAAVVERHIEGADVEQLIVRDTLEALGDLARECVRLLDIPKIGVTGSVGKTTVRAMIAHVLSGRYNVRQSEGNQNNEIGVPLTLFGLTADHTAAVIEMGMRGRGQIAYLASIVKPTIAVVTNVGISHIELLGSQDAIADAKAEILDRLPPSGLAVLPRGDAYYDYLSRRCQCRVRSFALDESADFVATDAFVGPDGKTRFVIRGVRFEVPVTGVHNAGNAAAACAVASELGVSLEEAAERLRSYQPPDMRMTIRQCEHGVTVLDDTYNAAPDSVRAALATLSEVAAHGRRRAVAVLGDMRELGSVSAEAHAAIGASKAVSELGLLVTVGADAALIADATATEPRATSERSASERSVRFTDADAATRGIRELVKPGDVVLVKGSRALGMERIVAELADQTKRDTEDRVPER